MRIHTKSYFLIYIFFIFILIKTIPVKAELTKPVLNNGKKWRIAYLEGGSYINYKGSLKATIKNLMEIGWIEKDIIPESKKIDETKSLWKWLTENAKSQYLTFLKDAYWSSEWKTRRRKYNLNQIKNRVRLKKDIDMFIGMGTWAGKDLVAVLDKTPVIIMSCSDPVRSGIVRSAEDSGKDNVFAWCDPTRMKRRIRLFHTILGFKKLGVIYENNNDGKIYANLSDIKEIAKERNFKIVECHAGEVNKSLKESKKEISDCMKTISSRIDAFFISNHRGFNLKFFPEIIEPLFDEKIPAFSPTLGPPVIKRGALMGIARGDYNSLGIFYASAMARIFNGSKPRDLKQIFREPIRLAINLESAQKLKFRIPPNLKKIADILYEKIDRSPLE